MSMKQRIMKRMFAEQANKGRLADCIEAGIAQVAKMGHVKPEDIRLQFDQNLMLCGFSFEEVQRLHTDAEAERVKQTEDAAQQAELNAAGLF